MIFITAGMGGGTGTGAAPIVAEVARDLGILTVGIVTKPLLLKAKKEWSRRKPVSWLCGEHVDSLLVIPNERLKLISEQRITLGQCL